MVTSHRWTWRAERGRIRLGCVLFLLVCAAVAYFGTPVGLQAFKYYQLADEMKTQVRFAGTLTDEELQERIRDRIDELELPAEAARRLRIDRSGRPPEIRISTSYTITFEFPFYTRSHTFRPEARGRI
jgi:hypothetical protein